MIEFDSGNDESKPENPLFDGDVLTPDQWCEDENPPYAYYTYYMYVNMTVLNHFHSEWGISTFVLRPHLGEAGPVQHLVCGYLMAENISHDLQLLLPLFQSMNLTTYDLTVDKLDVHADRNTFHRFDKFNAKHRRG